MLAYEAANITMLREFNRFSWVIELPQSVDAYYTVRDTRIGNVYIRPLQLLPSITPQFLSRYKSTAIFIAMLSWTASLKVEVVESGDC